MKTYFKIALIFFLVTAPLFSEAPAQVSKIEDSFFYTDSILIDVNEGDVYHIYRKTGSDDSNEWNFIDSAFVREVEKTGTKFEFVWYGEAQYIEEGDYLIPAGHVLNQRNEVVKTMFETSEKSNGAFDFFVGGGISEGVIITSFFSFYDDEVTPDNLFSLNVPFYVEYSNLLYMKVFLNESYNLTSSTFGTNTAFIAGLTVPDVKWPLSYYIGLGYATNLDNSEQGLILNTGARFPLGDFSEKIELPLYLDFGLDYRNLTADIERLDLYLNLLYKL